MLSNGEYGIIESIEVETLDRPEPTYNLEVEDYHTYYVGNNEVLVHNSCRSDWDKTRRNYWKDEGQKNANNIDPKVSSNSGKYKLSQDNINRMQTGKAPIGVDGKSVNLHHVDGIKKDPFNFVELTRQEHYENFVELHPWMFNKR